MAAQHAADSRRNCSALINRAESDLRRNASIPSLRCRRLRRGELRGEHRGNQLAREVTPVRREYGIILGQRTAASVRC
jgi:hypothetical protein